MNQLDFVADELLSGNDGEVLTKKREYFKKILIETIDDWVNRTEARLDLDLLAEMIVKNTFDESVVN